MQRLSASLPAERPARAPHEPGRGRPEWHLSGAHAIQTGRFWILGPDSSACDASGRFRPPAAARVALENWCGAAQRVGVVDARVVPGVIVVARLCFEGEARRNEAGMRLGTTTPARLDEDVSLALPHDTE